MDNAAHVMGVSHEREASVGLRRPEPSLKIKKPNNWGEQIVERERACL